MGNRLTEGNNSEQTESRSYGDIFDELFPHYLVMGMTPEAYWDGESWLKRSYRKAYQIRMENEQRLSDRNNWYMGQYLICVLQAVPLLVGGLNVKSSTRLPSYPEKPFLERIEAERKETVRKKQEEDQTKLAMAMFQAGIAKFNQRMMENKKVAVESGQ